MRNIYAFWCAALLFTFLPLTAQKPDKTQKPDSTAVNKRDRAKGSVTADQQSNQKTAVRLTSQIRKSLMADKDLSTYAHNVKIIDSKGVVTLKGPVRSAEEKAAVLAKAVEVAGAGKVRNELTVAPAKTSATHGRAKAKKKLQDKT
jgi:hyperosmotically inducible protein